MVICPKCRSVRISGPRYARDRGFGCEAIVYTCRQCGYSQNEPTADADANAASRLSEFGEATYQPSSPQSDLT